MSEASNPSPPRTGAVPDKKGSDDDDSMSIELEDLVAKEVAEWKSPNAQGTLRHRKTKSSNVLDESNVFVPYDPISPTQLTDSSAPSSPSAGPSRPRIINSSAPPVVHSPLPKAPVSFIRQSSTRYEPPAARSRMLPSPPVSSRTVSSASSARALSPHNPELSHSGSSASSFTPAVIGPRSVSSRYGTPRTVSDAGRSGDDDVMSLPDSRITSPFSDLHAVSPELYNRSPSPVILSPGVQSPLIVPSVSDMAILSPSLRSGMFSPTISYVDDGFDIDSVDGSEISSWASVGRRTPES
ncbi:hypothetical protein PHLCEN_2v5726 [Hermanssonia centrifuga]|uniref:Uncharacterized protein n=1 Tax=Hermanssonia centrifuga TaxID=98765 RepID=A0A2R6P217_9APHY|nr:hypothetical protein PHLCEN_2v5726 [Hermanssonia centrifuga]